MWGVSYVRFQRFQPQPVHFSSILSQDGHFPLISPPEFQLKETFSFCHWLAGNAGLNSSLAADKYFPVEYLTFKLLFMEDNLLSIFIPTTCSKMFFHLYLLYYENRQTLPKHFPHLSPLFLRSETAPLAVTFSIAEINKCKTETVVSILLWSRKDFFLMYPRKNKSKVQNRDATAKVTNTCNKLLTFSSRGC